MNSKSLGFSLVELMIVVVVIGVLASIAYPSYTQYVQKSKRAEAKTRLLQVAQLQERFFTENNSYTTNIATLLGVTGTVYSSESNSATSGYQVTVAATSGMTIANSFTLTATPQGQQTADTTCGTLTLQNTGAKGKSGTGSLSDCWN